MLKNLKEHIEKIQARNNRKIDTASFNDPLADRIDWYPMKSGGANFTTHVLKQKSSTTYRYSLSIQALLFCGVFILVGLVMTLIGFGVLFGDTDAPGIILSIFGLIFGSAGLMMLKMFSTSINFDTMHGYLWKGSKKPKLTGNIQDQESVIYFSEIHAIQIISERIRGDNSTYYSHEVNLVLRDGSRFHVIDHGNYKAIQKDIQTLSQITSKPLWDASIGTN